MQNEIKMFSNKKGFNDATIMTVLLFIFIGVGLILPFITNEFQGTETVQVGNIPEGIIDEDIQDVSGVGAGDILKSIGKMFFWTFGELPFWLDGIFLVLRVLLLFILVRNFVPFLGSGG